MLELNVCQSQVTQYLFFLSTDFDRGLRNADTAWHLNNQNNLSIGRGGYRTLRCNQGRQNKTDIRKKVIAKYIQKTIQNARFWIQIPVCHRKNQRLKYACWQRFEWSKLCEEQNLYIKSKREMCKTQNRLS